MLPLAAQHLAEERDGLASDLRAARLEVEGVGVGVGVLVVHIGFDPWGLGSRGQTIRRRVRGHLLAATPPQNLQPILQESS